MRDDQAFSRKLRPRHVAKPWGRAGLPPPFADAEGQRIGEVWFVGDDGQDDDLPLLVKYIFTSERLSIQVHPSDERAAAIGFPRGKEEIWYILDCEPGAMLGIGLTCTMTPAQFRAAALDGSLERFIAWRPVKPGDCYFIPAGTVHAIGAGITLVEVQQNSDITYRLYDYGRPRALHLDEGEAVSRLAPYERDVIEALPGRNRRLACASEAPFSLDLFHWDDDAQVTLPRDECQLWFTPLSGSGTLDGARWAPGECWLIDGRCDLRLGEPASVLLAAPR